MPFLVDTNILVYRHDGRFPEKQRVAQDLLRQGLASGEARVSHQAIIETVAALTRGRAGTQPLMAASDATRVAEELTLQFPVIYPDEAVVRLALRGWGAYGLSWFDAHMWASAERHGIPTLYSEDFQSGRIYGSVRVVNPFSTA